MFSSYWVQPGGAQVGFPCFRGPVCHRIQFCLMLYLLLFEKGKKGGKEKERNG
jgi:hypothetical protein